MPPAASRQQHLQVTLETAESHLSLIMARSNLHRSVMFASQSGLRLLPAAQHEATGPDGRAVPPSHLQNSGLPPQIGNFTRQHSHFVICRQAPAQDCLAELRLAVGSHSDLLLTATYTCRLAAMWKLLMVPDGTCCAIHSVLPAMKPSHGWRRYKAGNLQTYFALQQS